MARGLPKDRPIRVVLRGGTYRLKETLALDAKDSGVAWVAAKGERPVFSGGVPLKGWETTKVNGLPAWRLRLPDLDNGSRNFRSLYGADDARRLRARSPNKGFFVVGETVKREGGNDWLDERDRFVCGEQRLRLREGKPAGARWPVFNGGAPAMLFRRNIVLANDHPLLNGFEPNNVRSIYTFQGNLFWRADGSKVLPDNARSAGWGKDSVELDPLFVAPERGDFRLWSGSPAALIGFNPVDGSKAGPRK